jgi:hypothetical protein
MSFLKRLFSKRERPKPELPKTEVFEIPDKPVEKKAVRPSGTFCNNPTGSRRNPPTWMPSPDNRKPLKHPRKQKGGYGRTIE